MARFKIQNNADINLLTQEELQETLSSVASDWFQEEARGYSVAPIYTMATVSGGKVVFPNTTGGTGGDSIGPDDGFAWRVNRLTLAGLSTGDTVTVYKNTTNQAVDVITAAKPAIYPGKGLIMRNGDRLLITGSGLTATGDLILTGEVAEVPALDLFKIL